MVAEDAISMSPRIANQIFECRIANSFFLNARPEWSLPFSLIESFLNLGFFQRQIVGHVVFVNIADVRTVSCPTSFVATSSTFPNH